MKVAFICASFPTNDNPQGGPFNVNTVRALRDKVELHIIKVRAMKPGRPILLRTEFDGIPYSILSVPFHPLLPLLPIISNRLCLLPHWRAILNGADLIHAVEGFPTGVLASHWARRLGIGCLIQINGSDTNIGLTRYAHSLWLAGWELGIRVIGTSRALCDTFSRLYPHVDNVHVVYRGTDIRRFHPAEMTERSTSSLSLLYLGGCDETASPKLFPYGIKGGRFLRELWASIETRLPANVHLVIAGPQSGSDETRRWHSGLAHRERVELRGNIPYFEMPKVMRAADVLLIPSFMEGLPNAAVEASACGLPVLGSAVGGLPEVIEDGVTGLLLPAGDLKAWCDALLRVTTYHAWRLQLGIAARVRMTQYFDAVHYRSEILQIYNDIYSVSSSHSSYKQV